MDHIKEGAHSDCSLILLSLPMLLAEPSSVVWYSHWVQVSTTAAMMGREGIGNGRRNTVAVYYRHVSDTLWADD